MDVGEGVRSSLKRRSNGRMPFLNRVTLQVVCQITKRNIQASFIVSMVDVASTVHIGSPFGAKYVADSPCD